MNLNDDTMKLLQQLLADPTAFQAKIDQYQKLKEEVDQKLQHIQDLDTIAALKTAAQSERNAASEKLGIAETQAQNIVGKAKGIAESLVDDATTEAKKLKNEAVIEAQNITSSARVLMSEAVNKGREIEVKFKELFTREAAANSMMDAAKKQSAAAQEMHALASNLHQRLTTLKEHIHTVITSK